MSLLARLMVVGEAVLDLRPDKRGRSSQVEQVKPEVPRDDLVPEVVVQKDSQKFGREARVVMTIFAILVAGLIVTWFYWDEEYLSNNEDLVYNLGLIGGLMMLLQFVYAMRKRLGKMRNLGQLKMWFAIHTFIGLSAPVIIIIHSRFDIQSINGGVAFFAMLMVVFSGIVGRYLYSQVNFDLSDSRVKLKELHGQMQTKVIAQHKDVVDKVESQLKAFMVEAFSMPKGVVQAFSQSFGIGLKSRVVYWNLVRITPVSAAGGSSGGIAIDETAESVFDREERKILKQYLKTLTRLARYNAFKQLFGLWRIGHVPVIYLLLISGLAHVLAVHMY